MIVPTMEYKPLHIPKSKRWKGLVVYCRRCKTNMQEICNETGHSLEKCPHPESHFYKVYVHVPGTKNQRKTKNLETRDLNEAIKQAIEFEKEVKAGMYRSDEKTVVSNINNVSGNENNGQTRPELLIHILARYCAFLQNEGVPKFRQRVRSKNHILDIERAMKYLILCLKKNGHDLNAFSINSFNENITGEIYEYFEEMGIAPRTFNKYFGFYSSLLRWYSDEYDVPVRNWFARVPRKKLNPRPESISFSEYSALLKMIKPENGIAKYENGVRKTRNYYRPWLTAGIRLGLETGRRREEIINMKWSDIKVKDGIEYLQVEDIKVNRIQNRTEKEEKKQIFVPLTDSLKELLNELGYRRMKNTDSYILAPEVCIQRNRIMADVLSRGFTHYYNQLGTGRNLTFKSLRKTYITNLQIFMGNGNVKALTGHSGDGVIQDYYIDKERVAIAAQNFSVFPKESERKEEIAEIRIESNNKQKHIKLEV